jgi:hypothetical protein
LLRQCGGWYPKAVNLGVWMNAFLLDEAGIRRTGSRRPSTRTAGACPKYQGVVVTYRHTQPGTLMLLISADGHSPARQAIAATSRPLGTSAPSDFAQARWVTV